MAKLASEAFDSVTVRCAETVQAAQVHGRRARSNLVLLDVATSDQDGADTVIRLRRKFPRVPIAVICDTDDVASMASSLKAGAVGAIPRDLSAPALIAALRLIQAGCTFLPPQLASHIHVNFTDDLANAACALTKRQRELLRFVLKGHKNAKIAKELAISEGTVKQHVNAIFKAIGVSSRSELLALAVRGRVRRDGSSITEGL